MMAYKAREIWCKFLMPYKPHKLLKQFNTYNDVTMMLVNELIFPNLYPNIQESRT